MVSLRNDVCVVWPHQFTAQGIELVLYFKTMRIYLARRRNPRKCDAFYAIFSTAMFLVVTIWIVVISMLGYDMWLLDAEHARGSMTSVSRDPADALWDCAVVVTIILQQMTDGLMVRPNGSNVATERELTWSVPGVPLSNSVGQPSCHHHTLLPVVHNPR